MYYSTTYSSPLGTITLACYEDSLIGLWIEGQKYHGATLPTTTIENNDRPVFNTAKKWLDRYFAGEKPDIAELSLAPIGGEFRQLVWQILCEIPSGKIITYGDIAKKIAVKMGQSRMSSQAIGGAVGHNPIAIIIPCHRVVGAKGNLTGFAGGLQRKVTLLELEGVDMSNLFIPKKCPAL
jgi:methylated-DNA-[protein]-cysteine S-methyltransferase